MKMRQHARNRTARLGWTIGAIAAAMCATARATTVAPGQTVGGASFLSAAMTTDSLVTSETNMYTVMDGVTPVSTGTITSSIFRAAGTGDLTFVYDISFTSDAGSYALSSFVPSVSTDVNFVNVPQDASVSVSRDLNGMLTVNAGSEPPDLAGQIMVATNAKSYSNFGSATISAYSDTFVNAVPTEVSGSATVGIFEPSVPLTFAADAQAVPLPPAVYLGLAGIVGAIVVQSLRPRPATIKA